MKPLSKGVGQGGNDGMLIGGCGIRSSPAVPSPPLAQHCQHLQRLQVRCQMHLNIQLFQRQPAAVPLDELPARPHFVAHQQRKHVGCLSCSTGRRSVSSVGSNTSNGGKQRCTARRAPHARQARHQVTKTVMQSAAQVTRTGLKQLNNPKQLES